MTTSEAGPAEREEQLVKLRHRMGKALRRGEMAEYDRLSASYGRLKSAHVLKVHEEHVAGRRAAVAERRAQQRAEVPKRWKLPSGFSSPLAAERARSGWRPREEPVAPAGGLRPWRRYGSPMSERIWKP
ncbi:hypothetical protein [Streptomyces ureilyticus]|uniref:Uncharacterized protein n=1 Tax=Streptomyces ureilyticus TaxID=1775131 RepID=A0ABX0DSM5_9ACTN|nr:hypothetical protein [Streptomyces ureilyticus]NGO43784.1 hypothetical protein [Streptomyces ureilyticus]